MVPTKSLSGNEIVANCAIASSIPRTIVRIRTRTLTSHASHNRFSKAECMMNRVVPLLCMNTRGVPMTPLALVFLLPRQFRNHGEERHVQRSDDAADHHAE